MKAVSIVVPTLNESENVPILVERIAKSFRRSGVRYEVIFIDDHSTDGTIEVVQSLSKKYPIRSYKKVGSRGKAYSLLQGFALAQYDVICMIDADLQYPPEAILPMYRCMVSSGTDIVLTERQDDATTSKLRQISSKVFNLAFTRLLFGFNYDSQSGLKLFRKEVYEKTSLNPTPWSFDLEFIVRALENNYKIISYKIPFSKRHSGHAKVRLLRVTYELTVASIKLRLHSSRRKIKQAYRMNLKISEEILGVLLLLASVTASLHLIQPYRAGASLPAQTVLQVENTPVPLPPILMPSNSEERPADTEARSPEQHSVRPDSGSRTAATRVPNVLTSAANTPQAADQLQGAMENAGISYPRPAIAPVSTYKSPAAPLPTPLVPLWVASSVAVLVLAAAYVLAATLRGKRIKPNQQEAQ